VDETRLRLRNLQSAMARLTSQGLIDCGFLCALRTMLPANQAYPNLREDNVAARSSRLSWDAVCGAQWLLYPEEGRWLYAQCKQAGSKSSVSAKELGEELGPREMWSLERWREWKRQYQAIAEGAEENLDQNTRALATEVVRRMEEYERGED
jgi:hypothetical protein